MNDSQLIEGEEDRSINVDKAHLGEAGEYLTAGKLLLNGFNVFKGAIDEGIDLVASKGDFFYKIQVKTSQDIEGYDSGHFVSNINLTTLTRHNPDSTYIVFVLHFLGPNASLDNAGNHNAYEQVYVALPVQKILDMTKKRAGHITARINSTITGENYSNSNNILELRIESNGLVLDDYLLDSLGKIGSYDDTTI